MALSSDPDIQSPITLDEYLHTAYQPDCDFVDGEVLERLWGEAEHSETQGALAYWFGSHDSDWNPHTLLSLRLRVAPTRIRVADVCLISRDASREQIPTAPPSSASTITAIWASSTSGW
jgi:hypothetical protein